MSQISETAAEYFANGEGFNRGSTKVRVSYKFVGLWLENKQIARRSPYSGQLTINLRGCDTQTMRSRLNGVLLAAYRAGLIDHSLHIARQNGTSYLRNTAPGAIGYKKALPEDGEVSIFPLR